VTSAEQEDTPKVGSMALTPFDTEGVAPLRGPEADMWRTLAAWLWTTYLALVTGAVLWWVF